LRAGDKPAATALITSLLPVADEFVRIHRGGLFAPYTRDDLQSQVHLDTCMFVSALAGNETPAQDVEQKLRQSLRYSLAHMLKYETDDVLPTRGDKVAALRLDPDKPPKPLKRERRRGRPDPGAASEQQPYPGRKGQPHAARFIDPLEDPEADRRNTSRANQRTAEQEMAHREDIVMATEIASRLHTVARTPIERTIAGCLAAHLDIDDIKESLPGYSEKIILATIRDLSARLK
jgi:hypothetical protein